jgi:small-conductance mechanosensitive channel
VVAILRTWTIPLFALWALLRGLFGLSNTNLFIQVLASGLLLSAAAATLVLLRIVITRYRDWSSEEERGGVPQLLLALPRIGIILITGWFLIDGVWGVDLSAALAALGVTSLIVSFALQDTLSGLASGLLLLSDSPFQPGDWIRTGDLEGKVLDVNWRSSRIQDRNGDLHVVPNAQLAGSSVVNFDQPARLHRVVVPVQVAYVNPPTLAKEMLLDAARSTPGVLAEPPPGIRVVQIDDPLMGYEVDLWIEDFAIAPRVFSDFGSLVWYQSHRHEVPLPSPAQDLYLYDGPTAGLDGIPDATEIRRRLQSSPLLLGLDDGDLDMLAANARAVRFARGETIVEMDLSHRELSVLWTGAAQLSIQIPTGRLVVAELVPGDVFGLLGKSDAWPSAPTISALDDCELIVVEQQTAQEVISRDPALAQAINQVTNSRRRRIDRMLDSIVTRSQSIALPGPAPEGEDE